MRKRLLMIFCVVCLFLFLSSAVKAEKLSVPACSFIPEGHKAEHLEIASLGDYIYRKDTAEVRFYAPVYLPHGSIVKWIRFHVIDNDPINLMDCALKRVNKYTGISNSIYSVATSGASPNVEQFTDASPSLPSRALVNNDVCTYFVVIYFEGTSGLDKRVYGLTIYYE